jgi:hypothetical protein
MEKSRKNVDSEVLLGEQSSHRVPKKEGKERKRGEEKRLGEERERERREEEESWG